MGLKYTVLAMLLAMHLVASLHVVDQVRGARRRLPTPSTTTEALRSLVEAFPHAARAEACTITDCNGSTIDTASSAAPPPRLCIQPRRPPIHAHTPPPIHARTRATNQAHTPPTIEAHTQATSDTGTHTSGASWVQLHQQMRVAACASWHQMSRIPLDDPSSAAQYIAAMRSSHLACKALSEPLPDPSDRPCLDRCYPTAGLSLSLASHPLPVLSHHPPTFSLLSHTLHVKHAGIRVDLTWTTVSVPRSIVAFQCVQGE